MAEPRFDALPKELIASIASYSNARTVLSLVRTCRTFATACDNSVIFRDILLNSQARNWPASLLDIDAIAARCGKDVAAWARYAVADQTAVEIFPREHPFEYWDRYKSWVPELFAVNHPFMLRECWHMQLPLGAEKASTAQLFCFAQAVVAANELSSSIGQFLGLDFTEKDPNIEQDHSMSHLLWQFCRMVLKFHQLLKSRRNVWPFNDDAVVPYIPLPMMHELRMSRPVQSNYHLPLPYDDSYDTWFVDHARAMAEDPGYFTTGTWRGYYSYSDFFMSSEMLDPPMMGIKFRSVGTSSGVRQFAADGGLDGEGPFRLHVAITDKGDGPECRGNKTYLSGRGRWDWDLKVTPLGLIGYWGTWERTFSRKGFLWLWKAGEDTTDREAEIGFNGSQV